MRSPDGGRAAAREFSVAICDSSPDAYLPLIAKAVAGATLRVCADADELAGVAADVEVLLAFKFAGRAFPRDAGLGLPNLRWVQRRLRPHAAV